MYSGFLYKGGDELILQRRYISAVKPLDNYVLQVDFVSGSRLFLDLNRHINNMRFRSLKNKEVWQSAVTNGIFVRFGGVEIAHDELFAMAEEE